MSKPFVYITRKISNDVVKELEEHFTVEMWQEEEEVVPRDVLLNKAKQADAILSMLTDSIDEELLSQSNNLKVVANMAVGYDNIDVEAAKRHQVTVTNTPDVLTDTTADLTFALLMATARRLPEAVDYIKDDLWKTWSPYMLAGSDIHHKTLGIVGLGSIGQAVAKRATGFDMNVIYYNRSRKEDVESQLGVQYTSFDELLEQSDFVVCMTPLTPETDGLFNEETFNKMKDTAIFINSSRGGVVNEDDLYHALKQGDIKAAGLDVFQNEPIGADHPLLSLNEVVALPHIGSSSIETRTEMMKLAARNIKKVLNGEGPVTPI
ncbi:2-hydroxyacid dehydrogenase [Alkalibacillus haloalkaliphilus]|uniref:2-hydroxyacid dehydrogenase n=1 Tax=Alkalibacillus haloalkaliphilus TaxID=94136 RepID=UPI0029356FA5|nr:D-glycerate dehydrogenase [Alkalibacillus haloalkaliphilus]MDV2582102.1 D-glycerate dehydrogenase [Alkalibacillus haloalkaliphilus]